MAVAAQVHALVMLPMEVTMEILVPHSTLTIPQEVATCPYGDTPLKASFEAWTLEDDDTCIATKVTLECETEPVIGSDEFDAWRR